MASFGNLALSNGAQSAGNTTRGKQTVLHFSLYVSKQGKRGRGYAEPEEVSRSSSPMPHEAASQPQHGTSGHGALGDGFAQQHPGSLVLYLRWVLMSGGWGCDLGCFLLPGSDLILGGVSAHHREALLHCGGDQSSSGNYLSGIVSNLAGECS